MGFGGQGATPGTPNPLAPGPLLQGMESESDEELGYLDALDGEVEPGIVGAFFQAGIVFLQAAPWRSFPSERPGRVRVPKLRLERGALVVIGQSGQSKVAPRSSPTTSVLSRIPQRSSAFSARESRGLHGAVCECYPTLPEQLTTPWTG